MGGKEGCLFGIGAESRVDDQGEAGLGGARRHAVEGCAYVRSHTVSLAVDQWPAVAASRCHRGRRSGGRTRWRASFGYRRCLDGRATTNLQRRKYRRPHSHRRKRIVVWEGDAQTRRRHAVRSGRRDCSRLRLGQKSGLLDVLRIG
jgi:hypothetical protein